MRKQLSKIPAGPLLWIVSLQYFLMQIISAAAWTQPFSLRENTISDLGNTECALYDSRYVCSPLHLLMNASFVVQGITCALGAILIYKLVKNTWPNRLALGTMAIAGFGTIFVGIFPENTVSLGHQFGAALPFIFGNVSLLLLGLCTWLPKIMRIMCVISGIVALTALGLFVTNTDLGIGHGGIERITAYPQTIWVIIIGFYLILRRQQ